MDVSRHTRQEVIQGLAGPCFPSLSVLWSAKVHFRHLLAEPMARDGDTFLHAAARLGKTMALLMLQKVRGAQLSFFLAFSE